MAKGEWVDHPDGSRSRGTAFDRAAQPSGFVHSDGSTSRGTLSAREKHFNAANPVNPPPERKHPRNEYIDKAVEDAVNSTERGG